MIGFQIIAGTVILFIILRTVVAYFRRNISPSFAAIWLSIWFVALVFLFQENLLIKIANFVGIGRGVDLAIYISILVLFYLVYRVFLYLGQLNDRITKIVRHQALQSYDEKKVTKKIPKK